MRQIIRLTESDLHRLVKESVRRILRECGNVGSDVMIEDGIDEEGEIAGATNAQSSGQVLKGSGLSIKSNDKTLNHDGLCDFERV
jgi:hypothetical protein